MFIFCGGICSINTSLLRKCTCGMSIRRSHMWLLTIVAWISPVSFSTARYRSACTVGKQLVDQSFPNFSYSGLLFFNILKNLSFGALELQISHTSSIWKHVISSNKCLLFVLLYSIVLYLWCDIYEPLLTVWMHETKAKNIIIWSHNNVMLVYRFGNIWRSYVLYCRWIYFSVANN